METYYTVDQISELLSMHPKTIQRYIREGKLRANKIGKSWRVSGHDLSVFAENTGIQALEPARHSRMKTTVSSVIDIPVQDLDESRRIVTTLTAALNCKPQELGNSTMHVQHLESVDLVRVTLWGGLSFIKEMMDFISVITEQENDHED